MVALGEGEGLGERGFGDGVERALAEGDEASVGEGEGASLGEGEAVSLGEGEAESFGEGVGTTARGLGVTEGVGAARAQEVRGVCPRKFPEGEYLAE